MLCVDEEIDVYSWGGGPDMMDASLSVDLWWSDKSGINVGLPKMRKIGFFGVYLWQ